jgi:regulator of sigma E protease
VSTALGILALGFLIVVHEAGHYFVARWCQMRVDRFSIGFGPGILKRTSRKTGTVFQLAPIPFGGFVEIRGMNIAEEVDPTDPEAYPNRPAWQRFVTIFAGPATNYLSAIALAMALYTCHGRDATEREVHVDDVLPDYDAVGKLQIEDRILAVDGVPLYANEGETLTERVTKKQGAPVKLTIRRGGQELEVEIMPKPARNKEGKLIKILSEKKEGQKQVYYLVPEFLRSLAEGLYPKEDEKQVYYLGIAPSNRIVVDTGVIDAARHALEYPIQQTKLIASGLYGIIVGTEKADPGGPKRIVEEFSKAFDYSLVAGIKMLMMLSVYLGLFNLFPLPALDGGRLVFLGYEMVTRRRANPKIEGMVHMGGIMILGIVMILVTLHDFHVI